MSRLGRRAVALTALSFVAITLASGATSDAVADFSGTNPSGAWSYGWVAVGSTDTTTFQSLDTYQVGLLATGVNSWTLAGGSQPVVAQNTGPDDVTYLSGYVAGIVQPSSLLLLHPGAAGDWAVLRWTAPSTGEYSIDGYFQNIDLQPVIVDLAIGGTLSGPFTVDPYGTDFYTIGQLFFTAGQTLDFVVESGGAGATADVGEIPEPASLLLMGIGLLGLGFLKKRRA